MATIPVVAPAPLRARLAFILGAGFLAAATVFVTAADLDGNSRVTGNTASWIVFLLSAIAVLAAAIGTTRRILWRSTSLIFGLYCAVCATLAIARVLPFVKWSEVEFILAAPGDSARTFVEMGGPVAIMAAIVMSLLAGLAFSTCLTAVSRGFAGFAPPARLLLLGAVFAASLGFAGAPHLRLSRYPKGFMEVRGILPVVAKQPYHAFRSGESVFIVQMESLNGLLLNGDYVVDGKPVTGDFLPGMRRLAPKGISVPYFWAHDIFTHRGQQAILCGAVRNIHVPYFDELAPRTTDCLPELFRRAGYRTVFLSNYWDGGFSGIETFMKRVGFRDLHFADFMQPDDPLSVWGYDERAFFERAFDYLDSRYGRDEKLFVYLAISTHHAGFTRERGSDLQWFLEADRDKRLRQYLQSARMQDESLLTFYDRFHTFTEGNAHAFFVADHAFPMGLYGHVMTGNGATIDNYVTPFLYLPPARRADEFAMGSRMERAIFAQSDLLPTIAELLSGKPHQNSFVPFMKRNPPQHAAYEQCHVMSQLLQGSMIVIARGQQLYEYSAQTGKLRVFRLTARPLRQQLVWQREKVSFAEFDRTYGCQRYRPVTYNTARAR